MSGKTLTQRASYIQNTSFGKIAPFGWKLVLLALVEKLDLALKVKIIPIQSLTNNDLYIFKICRYASRVFHKSKRGKHQTMNLKIFTKMPCLKFSDEIITNMVEVQNNNWFVIIWAFNAT